MQPRVAFLIGLFNSMLGGFSDTVLKVGYKRSFNRAVRLVIYEEEFCSENQVTLPRIRGLIWTGNVNHERSEFSS